MDRLIYTALTGAKNTLGQQAAVANNLANATTSGFRAELHRLRAVPILSEALPSRAFAVDATVATDFSTGPLSHTGRALDVAIQGDGWFAVQGPDGREAYTRAGAFEVSANGLLQTHNGLTVLGDNGPISLPPDNVIEIAPDGTVSAVPNTGVRNTTNVVGRLKLVNPPSAQLERGGDGLFRLAGNEVAPLDETVRVVGGYQEGSNVNVVEHVVQMISLARHFDTQTRLLQTAQEDDQAANKIIQS